jgi:lipase chaperone LimK
VPQVEFDPALEVDVVRTPCGWRDPDLLVSAPDFLEAMRPLLDTYLAAQGEEPLQDMEWQVRRAASKQSVAAIRVRWGIAGA